MRQKIFEKRMEDTLQRSRVKKKEKHWSSHSGTEDIVKYGYRGGGGGKVEVEIFRRKYDLLSLDGE